MTYLPHARSRRTGTKSAFVRTALIAAFAGGLLAVPPLEGVDAATGATSSLTATESTFVATTSPNRVFSQYDQLVATSAVYRTFVKFDLSKLPAHDTLASASLKLSVRSLAVAGASVVVRTVSDPWHATTLTAANRPASGGAISTTVSLQAGHVAEVPLDPAAVADLGSTVSLEITSRQFAAGIVLDKKGAGAPVLHVTAASGSPSSSGTPTAPVPQPTTTGVPSPSATPTVGAPGPTSTPTATPSASPGGPSPSPTASSTPTVPSSTGSLPYHGAGIGTTPRVFAHYFTPFPISLDNKPAASDYYSTGYLDPDGEGGAHSAYGGLLRDRPLPRDPLSGDWQAADARTEVSEAVDAGIDGFVVDILSLSGSNWTRTEQIMDAAKADGRGFVIVPQIDMTTSAGKAAPADIAAAIASLTAHASQYRLPDGRPVVAAFKAEAQSAAWWKSLLSLLKSQYGIDVAFEPTFLNPSSSNMAAFAPISYALGSWGVRNPGSVLSGPNNAAAAHKLGVRWIEPVAVQDERPNQGYYQEAGNLEALRDGWQRAIDDGADMVQLVAWNDYSEGTVFAPSVAHGWAFLDVSGYYAARFKTGAWPAITGDAVYLTNRRQPYAAKPLVNETKLMQLMPGGPTTTQPRDTVEVQAFLTSAAQVTVHIGSATHSYTAAAGVSAQTFPLQQGAVSVDVTRASRPIASAVSPVVVTAHPAVQDLQYFAASSRDG